MSASVARAGFVLRRAFATGRRSRARTLGTALGVAAAYYVGARLGLALTFAPHPVSTLWPPNAILLAGLLLTPTRTWWLVLLAVFPAHLLVELPGGVPLPMVLCWFVSNSSEALIGALGVRWLVHGPLRFDTFRSGMVFVAIAGVAAAFLSSFLDAAFVELNAFGAGTYWEVWRTRFFSNVLATLTLGPAIITAATGGVATLRRASRARLLEAATLTAAIVVVSVWSFTHHAAGSGTAAHFLYAPLPLLLWAALRFGPGGASAGILVVAIVSIGSALNGVGPFSTGSPEENALALQLFLIVTTVPLLLLATVIEERERAQDAVREREQSLRETLDAADMGNWDLHVPSGFITWGDESSRILGIDARHPGIPITRLFETIHPDDRAIAEQAISHAVIAGTPLTSEFRVVRPDGDVHWVMAKGSVTYDEEGRPDRLLGLYGNVSARKRAELALRESEQRMALAATAAELGFWGMGLDGQHAWVSDHFLRIYGVEPGPDASPTACLDLIHPDDYAGVMRAVEATIVQRAPYDVEYRIQRPDGQPCWIHAIARIVRDDRSDVERIVGVITDVTAKRKTEQELREQQRQMAHLSRVAVVGELSGTIAHELNQPLTAILTNAQVAMRVLNNLPVNANELRTILGDIVDDDKRASAVIQRIRRLLRNDGFSPEPLRAADLATDVLAIMHGEIIERGVTTRLDIDPALPRVCGDRVQLQQVLLNLFVNACDAMSVVPTGRRRLTVIGTPEQSGGTRLSVVDSGPGIAASPADQIFEPFVSTKAGGLGLGLTICRSIVAAHGGRLWAENNPTGGATFHLVLPSVNGNGCGPNGV